MEKIDIKDGNKNIILYLDGNNYYGYQFNEDNSVTNVDSSVFNYFDFIVPSNNYKKLDDSTILDLDTNFKHYIKNGYFDIDKFFINNSTDCVLLYEEITEEYIRNLQLKKDLLELKKKRKFKIIRNGVEVFINISAIALTSILTYHICRHVDFVRLIKEIKHVDDYSYEDLCSKINASDGMDDDEKKLLENEDFFNDLLSTVNESNYMKSIYIDKFDNITINDYGSEDKYYESAYGYYNPTLPNFMYLRSDNKKEDYDTLSHEFVHLCQAENLAPVICESTAEIISGEYFMHYGEDTYLDQVRSVKVLMEIIGPQPIWNYVFTGNFDYIEKEVKPYLNAIDYDTFKYALWSFDYTNNSINSQNDKLLNEVLDRLYKAKYNSDIEDNKPISLLRNKDKSLVRYYFNKNYINKDNSYYYKKVEDEDSTCSIEDAYNDGLVTIIRKDTIEIDRDTYDNSNSSKVSYRVNFNKDNCIQQSRITNNKCDVLIDSVLYKDMDIFYLIDNNYVSAKYFLDKEDIVTYDEYINDFDKTYMFYCPFGGTVTHNKYYKYLYEKQYLPTTNVIGFKLAM